MQMKKIIGILLAMCFVLSVTAAAASAHEDRDRNFGDHHKDFKKFDDRRDFGRHHHNDFNRGHWVPGHYETKVIKTVKWFHGEKVVIKKFVKVWVPGKWVPAHHFRY